MRHPHHAQGRERCQNVHICKWHAAQYIDYGSGWHAHMPWVILFLQKLIPRKNSGRPPIYPKEFVQEGVKNVPLWKRHTQRKLAMLMAVSETTVHHWIVASTIHVHCNSLKPVLTEENKVARLLMALHFRDPVDLTLYPVGLDEDMGPDETGPGP